MMRTLTLLSLIVLNFSVWLGPLERLASPIARAGAGQHGLEQAESSANAGRIDEAIDTYRALLELDPDSPAYHYNFGLFCFNHGDALLNAGWSAHEIAETIQEHMGRARTLAPGDFSIANDYARSLMDKNVFDANTFREARLEAWTHVIELAHERQGRDSEQRAHDEIVAGCLLQLARVEARCGQSEAASAYIAEGRSVLPELHVPEGLESLTDGRAKTP